MTRLSARFLMLIVVVGLLMGADCVVTVTPDNNDTNDPDNADNTPTDVIQVRFVNSTLQGVRAQFYAISTLPDDGDVATALFAPANAITTGLGIWGTGILDGGGSDEVMLDCVDAVAIGTPGVEFLNDEGEIIGTGPQRILLMDSAYACEDQVTFIYQPDGEDYTMTYLVE